ncbi:MAG: carbohydrate ABC transporter permease, partial [Caldilineaceae bacterium]|nr:carbohydrate ABC transporter permease [Caldilineaceae bacterium]
MAATTTQPTKTIHTGRVGEILRRILLTSITAFVAFLFLLPFFNMVFTSLKTTDQMSEAGAPVWPAMPGTAEVDGKTLDVFEVPMPDGSVQSLAIVKKGRQESTFIDPENLEVGEIVWQGAWRTLERTWT